MTKKLRKLEHIWYKDIEIQQRATVKYFKPKIWYFLGREIHWGNVHIVLTFSAIILSIMSYRTLSLCITLFLRLSHYDSLFVWLALNIDEKNVFQKNLGSLSWLFLTVYKAFESFTSSGKLLATAMLATTHHSPVAGIAGVISRKSKHFNSAHSETNTVHDSPK